MSEQPTKRKREGSTTIPNWQRIDPRTGESVKREEDVSGADIRLVTREPVIPWRRVSRRRFNKVLRNLGNTPGRRHPK